MVDNCFLYVQQATGGKPERAAFDNDVRAGGLLSNENTLYVKTAVWLNDTGLAIHMEPTWVTVFQVEDAAGNAVNLDSGVAATVTSGTQTKKVVVKHTPQNTTELLSIAVGSGRAERLGSISGINLPVFSSADNRAIYLGVRSPRRHPPCRRPRRHSH